MRAFKRCAVLIFALALNGVALAQTSKESASMNGKHSDDCLAEKALGGDAEAAKACAGQYLKGDQKIFRYWTQIAAENGDVVSQYNFAIILLNRNNAHEKSRAIYWLKKASAKGYSLAQQVLDDIRLNPSSTIPIPPPPPNRDK